MALLFKTSLACSSLYRKKKSSLYTLHLVFIKNFGEISHFSTKSALKVCCKFNFLSVDSRLETWNVITTYISQTLGNVQPTYQWCTYHLKRSEVSATRKTNIPKASTAAEAEIKDCKSRQQGGAWSWRTSPQAHTLHLSISLIIISVDKCSNLFFFPPFLYCPSCLPPYKPPYSLLYCFTNQSFNFSLFFSSCRMEI